MNLKTQLIKCWQRIQVGKRASLFAVFAFAASLLTGAVFARTPDAPLVAITSQQQFSRLTQSTPLIVGSEQNFPPFATGMTDATASGFTVDLWKAVAADQGLKYRIRVLPFHQLLQEFKQGKIDVLINLAQSEERHQFSNFTPPHVVVHGAIFVRKGESAIRSEADLQGKSILVLHADLAHDYAVAQGWGKQIVLVDTAAQGMQLLASGQHDALLLSKISGLQTLQALGLNNVEALPIQVGYAQKFAFAVQHGQPELLAILNEGLTNSKASGNYKQLYEKWFGLYEDKHVKWQDLLQYIIPMLLLFAGIGLYFFYHRQRERQVMAAQLRTLHAAIEQAPISIVIADSNANIEYVNPFFSRTTGYSAQEVKGKNPRILKSGLTCEQIYPAMWDALNSGKAWHGELINKRKNGEHYCEAVHVSPVRDEAGVTTHYVAAKIDITERKRIKEQLSSSKNHLQLLLDSMAEGAYGVDVQGNCTFVNLAFLRILGYANAQELIGQNIHHMIHHSYADGTTYPAIDCKIYNTSRNAQPCTVSDEVFWRKDGTAVQVEYRAYPIVENAVVVGSIATFIDISERKQNEASTQRKYEFSHALNAILKLLVEESDAQLILDNTSRIVGEVLGADRTLIYDISFETQQIIGLSEWLNPHHPDTPSSIGTYPLHVFRGGANELMRSKHWIASHREAPHPAFLSDGSAEVLHNKLMIRSLLWYPFFIKENHFYALVLNQIHAHKEWSLDEVAFLDSVSQVVTVELDKIRLLEEHKKAENELRIAACAFEVTQGMMITNANKEIIQVNQAFTDISGYTLEEVKGKHARLLSSGFHDKAFFDAQRESIARTGSWQGELWNRRKNGEIFAEHLTITAVKDAQGVVVNYVGALTDITQRKLTEDRMLKLTQAVEQSPNSVVITNLDAEIEYANETFLKMTGYSRDEVIGKNPRILHSGKTPASTYDDMWATLKRGESWNGEFINRRKDGTEYTEMALISPVRQTDGRVTNYLAIKQDVTQYKQSQLMIQEQQIRLSNLIDSAMDAIISVDDTQNITLYNRAAENMFGYKASEMLEHSIDLLLSLRFRDRHAKQLAHYGQTGSTVRDTLGEQLSLVGLRKNGEEFPCEVSISINKVNGENNYTAIVRDTTHTHYMLEKLRNTADKLAQANVQIETERAHLSDRVMERTAQLLLANKAKDSFLATMSHEIRTPMGGLLGMVELLGLSDLNTQQQEMVRTAMSSGKSLLRIVDDILDWSKIEAGKLALSPQVSSLTELLQGVQRSYAQLASAKGIKLGLRVDDKLAAAHHFDPLRLSQILNNFTSNAIKFTEMGTVEIYAQHVALQEGSEELCLGVQDSGCGISPEARARLFQHYEQGSAETARMYGGTGLGLSICRSLAELMGGSIGVHSELGVGSNFQVILKFPVANAQAQRELQLQHARQEAHENKPDIRSLATANHSISVLIVDDHPVNRALLKQQLEQLGVQVEAAAYGVVALSLWWTGHFDLVITDCHMPEMDGYELTRSIREMEIHDERARIPIIAWTANVMVEEEARCRAAGMDDLLTKPTELAVLRAMLIKWLDKVELLAEAEPMQSVLSLNAILDLTVLQKIAVNPSEQLEILQEFQQYNRDDIASLLMDLEHGDAPAIASSAHRIKGACRMVGALELADLCLKIEQAAKQGDLAAVRALPSTALQDTVTRLETAIAQLANV